MNSVPEPVQIWSSLSTFTNADRMFHRVLDGTVQYFCYDTVEPIGMANRGDHAPQIL